MPEKFERIFTGLALVLTAAGSVGSLTGILLNPIVRPSLFAVAGAFFILASFASKQASSPLVDGQGAPLSKPNNGRKWIWLPVALLFLLVAIFEISARLLGAVPLAKIDGPFFQVLHPSAGYERWPFERIPYSDEQLKEFDSERRVFRERKEIDNFELSGAIGPDAATALYSSPLGEHFGFDIHKTEFTDTISIQDIKITVLNYEPVPPFAMGGADNLYNNYIVVINLDKRDEPLPWEFNAELLLDNPATKSVVPWNRKTIRLTDSKIQGFLVKLGAKRGGIYTYCASIVVKDRLGIPVEIDLIPRSKPRTCMFEGGEPMGTQLSPPVETKKP